VVLSDCLRRCTPPAEAFRHRRQPMETFHDGVAVAEILMALYRSAEIGQTVRLPAPELETYVPAVARS
jgi:hypothetical protein